MKNNQSPIAASSDNSSLLTVEEQIIEKILLKINKEDLITNPTLIEIKNDLENLKNHVSESDFKVRYLKGREKSLQQFIDNFPAMLGYWNKELVNVHSNNVYANYFGKSPEEIRGQRISEILGEKIFQLNFPYIEGVLNGKPQTFERDIPTPKGSVKSTLANYIPHFVNDEVVGFFVIVTDITEKRVLEEKTKRLEATLYEQSRLSSLGQMASGIAHEINNPIAIIYSNACLLIKEYDKPACDKNFIIERLGEIKKTSLRIEKIVDGLRSLLVGNSSTPLETHNLTSIIEQVITICNSRFTKSNLKIIWQPPGNAVLSLCNDIQVSEILLNLLNNAYDAILNTKNGQVSISISKKHDHCEIKIKNNGPPIDTEQRKKLFLPFYTTKGKAGTGLGLKISRDLARANGGDLQLTDQKETEFIIILKLATN